MVAHDVQAYQDAKGDRVRRIRELLRDYVLVLANSGMRTGDANSLRIRDVIPFKDEMKRDAAVFTGSARVQHSAYQTAEAPIVTGSRFQNLSLSWIWDYL